MSFTPPRPTTEDCRFPLALDTWPSYWQALGQEWRTEPEISTDRQNFLTQLRETESNEEERSYPFQGIELSRGDIEWLLIKRKEATRPTINEVTKPIISSTFNVDADDPFMPPFDDLDDLGSEPTFVQDFGDNKTDIEVGTSNVDVGELFILPFDDLDDLGSEPTFVQDFGDNKTDIDEDKSDEPEYEYEYPRLNVRGAILRQIMNINKISTVW